MMENKTLALIGMVAVCAFVGGMMLNTGAPETGRDSGNDFSPPPLPEEPERLDIPSDNQTGESLAGLFGDSSAIEPPPLPL